MLSRRSRTIKQYLVNRLAYRIQELAYGGIKPAVRAKLDAMADALDPKAPKQRTDRPVVGTQLIREWKGVEQRVTVVANGFEWQGRRFKSAVVRSLGRSPERDGMARHSSAFGAASRESRIQRSGQSAAPSIRANPPKRGSNRSSTPSTPSARPARRSLPARNTRVGSPCRTGMTMAVSLAARWTDLRCSG